MPDPELIEKLSKVHELVNEATRLESARDAQIKLICESDRVDLDGERQLLIDTDGAVLYLDDPEREPHRFGDFTRAILRDFLNADHEARRLAAARAPVDETPKARTLEVRVSAPDKSREAELRREAALATARRRSEPTAPAPESPLPWRAFPQGASEDERSIAAWDWSAVSVYDDGAFAREADARHAVACVNCLANRDPTKLAALEEAVENAAAKLDDTFSLKNEAQLRIQRATLATALADALKAFRNGGE